MKKNTKQYTIIYILIFLFVLFFLLYTKFPSHPFFNVSPKPVSQTYSGTLPCADCPGIFESVTFIQTGNNPPSGSYSIKDVYKERNDNKPFVTTSTWVETQGTPNDPNAIVYELMPETNKGQISYYLKLNDTQIVMLDSDKKMIDSPFDMKLTKQ